MPFFLPPDPSMGDAGSDYIPIDPRRRGRLPLAPPMSPSIDMSAAPPPPAPAMIPYVPQPPNPTSQGLISALQGDTSWQNAPAPRPYVSPRDMMRQYGITDLTPPPAPQVNPAHGFWGKLGQHLLGAAEGAGSQRGLLPMIVGGIAGGVRPQLGANAWYNNVTAPRWQQQVGAQQGLANTRLNQIKDVAGLTGVDPTTGEPSYAATQAENKQDLAEQIAQIRANHDLAMEKLNQEREADRREYQTGRLSEQQVRDRETERRDREHEETMRALNEIRDRTATTGEGRAAEAARHNKANEGIAAGRAGQVKKADIDAAVPEARAALVKEWTAAGKMTPDGKIIDPNYKPSDKEKIIAGVTGQQPQPRAVEAEKSKEFQEELRARATQLAQGRRGTGGAAPGQGQRIQAQTGKTVSASQLGALLTHDDVKKMGITDVHALRKALIKQGYTIDETQ